MKKIICDIDGVLADCTQRLKFIQGTDKDWDAFFAACDDDEPLTPMIEFITDLSMVFQIVYVTGRPERVRYKTTNWFIANRVPWMESSGILWMREDGDHREDFVLKREFLKNYMTHSNIAAVFEDRDQVVKMWRDEGLLCLQPKKGDY